MTEAMRQYVYSAGQSVMSLRRCLFSESAVMSLLTVLEKRDYEHIGELKDLFNREIAELQKARSRQKPVHPMQKTHPDCMRRITKRSPAHGERVPGRRSDFCCMHAAGKIM